MDKLSPVAATAKRQDAFDRLSVTGRACSPAIAGMAFSFFVFGYALIYWRNADLDFMVISSALAMNDGKQQTFFGHTEYLTILSVKYWFKLLHGVGLLDAWSVVDAAGGSSCRSAARKAPASLPLPWCPPRS